MRSKHSRKTWKKRLLSFSLHLFLLLIGIVIIDWYRSPKATVFENIQLVDIYGHQIHFNETDEKPTILYFWGSWCIYCRHTSPTIQTLYQEGYPVVSIAMQSGNARQVADYLTQHHWSFPVVNDPDSRISQAFGIQVTPTIAIIHHNKMALATSGWTSQYGLKIRLWLSQFLSN